MRGCTKQGLELGREREATVRQPRVVERLLAEAVARDEKCLAIAVPESEHVHAREALDALLTPLLPCVHDDLGVRVRAEAVAKGLQLVRQALEVVDLAVERDHDRMVFVAERLRPAGQVDDRQAPVGEPDAGLEVHAVAVGAPMRQ